MTTSIDIYFSKPPTPKQILTKVSGIMKVSKSSTNRIVLTYKGDTMELDKDKTDKTWQIRGQIGNYTADHLIADLNAP